MIAAALRLARAALRQIARGLRAQPAPGERRIAPFGALVRR